MNVEAVLFLKHTCTHVTYHKWQNMLSKEDLAILCHISCHYFLACYCKLIENVAHFTNLCSRQLWRDLHRPLSPPPCPPAQTPWLAATHSSLCPLLLSCIPADRTFCLLTNSPKPEQDDKNCTVYISFMVNSRLIWSNLLQIYGATSLYMYMMVKCVVVSY